MIKATPPTRSVKYPGNARLLKHSSPLTVAALKAHNLRTKGDLDPRTGPPPKRKKPKRRRRVCAQTRIALDPYERIALLIRRQIRDMKLQYSTTFRHRTRVTTLCAPACL